jgi:ABC-type antimicrobial peptide transport system ATPase subunit
MVLRVADELVVLDGGVVVETGAASSVALAPTAEYTRRLLDTHLSPIGA